VLLLFLSVGLIYRSIRCDLIEQVSITDETTTFIATVLRNLTEISAFIFAENDQTNACPIQANSKTRHRQQVGSLLGWRCAILLCRLRWYVFRTGIDHNGESISDTHTMRWEVYYPQSGWSQFKPVCNGENLPQHGSRISLFKVTLKACCVKLRPINCKSRNMFCAQAIQTQPVISMKALRALAFGVEVFRLLLGNEWPRRQIFSSDCTALQISSKSAKSFCLQVS